MAYYRWIKVLGPDNPQPDSGVPFSISPAGRELILLKMEEGKWRAWEPVCPHEKASLRGIRPDQDNCITCPLHRYTFSLEDGYEKQQRARLYLYPVEVRLEGVFVGL